MESVSTMVPNGSFITQYEFEEHMKTVGIKITPAREHRIRNSIKEYLQISPHYDLTWSIAVNTSDSAKLVYAVGIIDHN